MVWINNLRSACRAHVEHRARICRHGNMVGDTRHHSCHSVCSRSYHPLCWWSPFWQFRMHAIGQIAKQFIPVNITSREPAPPVRRDSRCCNHALSLRSVTVRSAIDCFRLSVLDTCPRQYVLCWKFQAERWYTEESFPGNTPQMSTCPGRAWPYDNFSSVQDLGIFPGWILAGCEDFVRHYIRSDFDPCRSWPISEMNAWFSCSKKLSRLHCLDWQAM